MYNSAHLPLTYINDYQAPITSASFIASYQANFCCCKVNCDYYMGS